MKKISASRADHPQECKGFWKMCGCDDCRARDRALEIDLENRPLLVNELAEFVVGVLRP